MQVIKLISRIMGVNTYVIYNEDTMEAVIIDPSFDARKIINCIAAEKLTVKAILLTHGHYDHICGVDAVKKEFGVPVYISREDAPMLTSAALNLSGGHGFPITCGAADVLIEDGQELELIGEKIKVISTPGHTKGSVTYQVNDVLFTGDTLFYLSIGRTDFPGGSFKEITESLKKLAALSGEADYVVHPGHEQSSSLEFETINNPYMQ